MSHSIRSIAGANNVATRFVIWGHPRPHNTRQGLRKLRRAIFILSLRGLFILPPLPYAFATPPLLKHYCFSFWGFFLVAVLSFVSRSVSSSGAFSGSVPGASAVLASAAVVGASFCSVRPSRRSPSGFVVVAFFVLPSVASSFASSWAAFAGLRFCAVRSSGFSFAVSVPCVPGSGFFLPPACPSSGPSCPVRFFRFLPVGL